MFGVASSTLAQCLPALTVCLAFASSGLIAAWPSPTLPKLEEKDSPIPVTRDEESWIVSLTGLGGLLAPALGFLMDRFGRKAMLISAGLPFITSWVIIEFAASPALLMVSRAIAGIGITTTFIAGPVYIGEIAQENIRGTLASLMDLFFCLGALLGYVVGPFVSFKLFGALCAILPTIFLLLMVFMPESPYYLLKMNKSEEARSALMRLRRDSIQGVQNELSLIQVAVEEETKNKGSVRDLFKTRASRRALLIAVGLNLIQQFSGIMAIISYAQQIFDLTPGISLTSSECAMVIGAIQVLADSFTSALVDRVGRRPLIICSTGGCSVALAILGTYLYIHSRHIDTSGFHWVPLFSLIMYVMTFCAGLSSLNLVVIGEVFASNVKGLAVSISIMTIAVSYIIVTKLYQIMIDSVGDFSAFWLFAAMSASGAVFLYCVLPETKGKRLETIIAELEGKPIF